MHINYKSEHSNFSVEEPGRHHIKQAKSTSLVMGCIGIMCHSYDSLRKARKIVPVMFLPKMHNKNFIMRKYQTTQNKGYTMK